jgi:DNA (cytosine-5)-methyltransferase 1
MSLGPKTYYNEIDPFAAQWLRNLIAVNLIADGDVDERDIRDVYPIDLIGYTQCHFFAGIGGWSYALRLADWPDDKPCWTGSCPCQPFSAAGQGTGFDDERHLWPAFFHLIEQCKPSVVFGEQVASKAGLTWLDLVQTDMEAANYATGAVDLCAAGIGAPHIRQRLFWCADSLHAQRWAVNEHREDGCNGKNSGRAEAHGELRTCDEVLKCADLSSPQPNRTIGPPERNTWDETRMLLSGPNSEVGFDTDTDTARCGEGRTSETRDGGKPPRQQSSGLCLTGLNCAPRRQRLQEQLILGRISIPAMEPSEGEAFVSAGYTRGFWASCDWWHGRDEKFRPIEPGVQPLASGVQKRMGKLRGYGNSIVPPLAAEFLMAYMEACSRS